MVPFPKPYVFPYNTMHSLSGSQTNVLLLPRACKTFEDPHSLHAAVSIGVCLFKKDDSNAGQLVAHPFNFYVFPHDKATRDLVLSPSAIAFNRKHGMDFQKWICEGISYITSAEEKAMRKRLWPVQTDIKDAR